MAKDVSTEDREAAQGHELPTFMRLAGPIEELTFLEKSLLFAELSRASYFSRAEAGAITAAIGLPEVRFYERDGAQAYLFANDTDAVIACRGTEPHEWNDIRADLDAATDVAETVGRVHRGFKREVDDLWPRLEEALISNEKTLWFTGHSLGGAMTAICAGRCKLSHINSRPCAVYTYGAPRVGNKRYVNHVRLEIYRWVNNNDIVPRVPPRWLGYRHAGEEVYLDRNGRIKKIYGMLRARDRFWGFLRSLRRWRIDHFSDHLMGEYITAICKLIEEERGTPMTPNTVPAPSVNAPHTAPDTSAHAAPVE